ncbi:MAG: hypothetical protein KME40_05020 [Komarekiella atlantica HA4396-MV6]|nr:hypothetical protein [Komarekiella atlantica HA4396-MV6]
MKLLNLLLVLIHHILDDISISSGCWVIVCDRNAASYFYLIKSISY